MQNNGAPQTRPLTDADRQALSTYGGATPQPPSEGADSAAFEIPRWLSIIAPSTLVPALAFYFGWTCTNSILAYFGVDPSVLGLTAQDYALRSADVLFIPAGAVLTVALLGIGVHSLALRH